MSELKFQATKVFNKIQSVLSDDWKILVLRGGTRSSKTYSTIQILLLRLLTGQFGDKHYERGLVHIVRKHKATITTTVQRDLEEIIDTWNVRKFIDIHQTLRTYKIGDRTIEFLGADDPQKLRGAKRDILYCNEANELAYNKEFFQLLIRTKDKVIIDFNPSDEDIRINTELEMKRQYTEKDVKVIVSTYKDNAFLSDNEIKEIENIKNVDPYLRQVYGLGGYGKVQGVIFDKWEIIDELPEDAKYLGHGLDFGFTNDPSSLIGEYRYDGALVLDEEFYKTGLTNGDISNEMEELGLERKKVEIIADSAEPKSIEELHRLKRNIKPCTKGADSINYGIQVMKGQPILITSRSINLIKEFKKYKWKEDKTGRSLNKPIDDFNHGIDAARYCAMEKIGKKKKRAFIRSI